VEVFRAPGAGAGAARPPGALTEADIILVWRSRRSRLPPEQGQARRAGTQSAARGGPAPREGAPMVETTPIVEYGAPIDARTMIEPPDVTELELEPGHPGLGDPNYLQRRRELF